MIFNTVGEMGHFFSRSHGSPGQSIGKQNDLLYIFKIVTIDSE